METPPETFLDRDETDPAGGDRRRLWTPWRMRYVGGGSAAAGCLFCRGLAGADDVRSLIVHRGRRAFAILNLYPYNTGHLMLVPNEHAASPERVNAAALAEMAALVPPTLRALRRVLGCAGFNLGMNVGADAGAGVADHMHEHVVPRWEGDANFMPILAATMVMPELIPVTYAKIRAELARELGAVGEVACVVFDQSRERVLAVADGDGWRLPVPAVAEGEALWRSAQRAVERHAGAAEIVGWGGPAGATEAEIGLAFATLHPETASSPAVSTARWVAVADAPAVVGDDARHVAGALDRLGIGGGDR